MTNLLDLELERCGWKTAERHFENACLHQEAQVTPSQSLLNSADRFLKLGQDQTSAFTRKMAEAAAMWPRLYVQWANEVAERADREEAKRRVR